MSELLTQLKERISHKISGLNYSTWFEPIDRAHFLEGTFTLVVPNKFIADWINDYYADLIRQELFLLTERNFRLAYDVKEMEHMEKAPVSVPEPPKQRAKTIPQL